MSHGADDAFWAQNDILGDPARYKDMPVYLVGGWYDSWAGNTTANFRALSGALKSPVYLIMGPWIHGAQGKSAHGQVDFGKDAAIADELAWRLEWFDHWLGGKENSVGKAAPFATQVRIFVMGTGDGGKTEKGLLRHGGSWREEQRVAAGARPAHAVLPPARRRPWHCKTGRAKREHELRLRSAATPCRRSAAISPPATASCCKARGISAAARNSGTGGSRFRSPRGAMWSFSRPSRSRRTSEVTGRDRGEALGLVLGRRTRTSPPSSSTCIRRAPTGPADST